MFHGSEKKFIRCVSNFLFTLVWLSLRVERHGTICCIVHEDGPYTPTHGNGPFEPIGRRTSCNIFFWRIDAVNLSNHVDTMRTDLIVSRTLQQFVSAST